MTGRALSLAATPTPTLPHKGGGRRKREPSAVALSRHTQMQAGLLLQVADDGEEIFRLRIAARAEHADQALGRRAGRLGELFEADGRLDGVAQQRLSGLDIAAQHGVDAFAQKRLGEFLVGLDVMLHQVVELGRSRHTLRPSLAPKRAEGGLHILLAGDAAAVRVVQRFQFLRHGAVDAGAARLDVARDLGKFFLILLRPGGHVLQVFFDRWAHGLNNITKFGFRYIGSLDRAPS
jgi:hypothetical protein